MTSYCIIAAKNDVCVDDRNKVVSNMNPNDLWHLHSKKDKFRQVDDQRVVN